MYEFNVCSQMQECIRSLNKPEDKVAMLKTFEDYIDQLRTKFYQEWTYCALCHQFVKVAERKTTYNKDGTYNVACGNCGGYHYVNKRG